MHLHAENTLPLRASLLRARTISHLPSSLLFFKQFLVLNKCLLALVLQNLLKDTISQLLLEGNGKRHCILIICTSRWLGHWKEHRIRNQKSWGLVVVFVVHFLQLEVPLPGYLISLFASFSGQSYLMVTKGANELVRLLQAVLPRYFFIASKSRQIHSFRRLFHVSFFLHPLKQ